MESLLVTILRNHILRSVLATINDFKRPKFAVFRDLLLIKVPAKKSLSIVNSVGGITRCLIECRSSNNGLIVSFERYDRRSRCHAFIVLDDLDYAIVPKSNTRVGCAEINADPRLISAYHSIA